MRDIAWNECPARYEDGDLVLICLLGAHADPSDQTVQHLDRSGLRWSIREEDIDD